ncbi:MAG TPA: flagellar biosynthetic protein FliO [Nitrospirota bacterium]|nr:flagellar biosynthetic protein FliO [Nitrospirota bacterium]
MIDLYLHMGVALILVSGLIFLLGLFIKKKQDKSSLMKVMGYQSLGPKKGMAMVKVGQEVLLLGVTTNDVKLLKTLNCLDEETGHPRSFEPEKTDRVIVANSDDRLKKLRAIKDALVCK